MAEHNIRVVTLLTGDEYLAMQSMADSEGMSDSAFIRRLLKLEAQKRAMERFCAQQRPGETTEPAQVLSKFHA
jgi:hypothetical protein